MELLPLLDCWISPGRPARILEASTCLDCGADSSLQWNQISFLGSNHCTLMSGSLFVCSCSQNRSVGEQVLLVFFMSLYSLHALLPLSFKISAAGCLCMTCSGKKGKKSPLKLNINDHPILKYGWFLKLNGCVLHFKWCCLSQKLFYLLNSECFFFFVPRCSSDSSPLICHYLSSAVILRAATNHLCHVTSCRTACLRLWTRVELTCWCRVIQEARLLSCTVASQLAKMAKIAAIFQMLEILRPYNRASNHRWARRPSIKVSVLTQCSCKSTPAERDEKALMISLFSAKTCKHSHKAWNQS